MLRTIAVIGLLPLLLVASPASAAPTKAQKMETCKFGADDQKLDGAKRNAFIKRCMAQGNFEPPGRKVTKKTVKKTKKPAAITAPAAPAAANPPPPPKQ